MSTIYERIEKGIKNIEKDKTEQIKSQVKEQVTHERLETLGGRLDFWEKCKATMKLWL